MGKEDTGSERLKKGAPSDGHIDAESVALSKKKERRRARMSSRDGKEETTDGGRGPLRGVNRHVATS